MIKRTFLITLILLIVVLRANAQVFTLGSKEFRLIENKWYNYSNNNKGDEIILDRIIVRLKNRGDVKSFSFAQVGLNNISLVSDELFGGYYVIKINQSLNPFDVATTLYQSSFFDYIEFDALGEYSGSIYPNDPYFNAGIGQWNLKKIKMPDAWDISVGDSSIILAIIDSGTDYNHEDLDGNIWVNPSEDLNGNCRPPLPWCRPRRQLPV